MTRFSHTNFFTGSLEKCDPALGRIVAQEGQRQQDRIELIAGGSAYPRSINSARMREHLWTVSRRQAIRSCPTAPTPI